MQGHEVVLGQVVLWSNIQPIVCVYIVSFGIDMTSAAACFSTRFVVSHCSKECLDRRYK